MSELVPNESVQSPKWTGDRADTLATPLVSCLMFGMSLVRLFAFMCEFARIPTQVSPRTRKHPPWTKDRPETFPVVVGE